MCLVPGLADGRFLLSNEFLPEELAVDVDCHCGGSPRASGSHRDGVSRRELVVGGGFAAAGLLSGGAFSTALAAARTTTGQNGPDRVVMLGQNGGPVLNKYHSQPTQCLVVNGSSYMIDLGGDAARQLVEAGLDFTPVRHVFVTHQHLDHTAGYAEFALLGWQHKINPLDDGVELWAPPPISKMWPQLQELYATGISLFEEIGSSSFSEILKVHELILPKTGVVKVTEDENVIVHATHVYHGPEVHHAYAYRFDLKSSGKSIVFSGDTTPNQNLVELAHDVDLLVHEAQMNRNIPIALSQVDPSERAALRKHLLDAHTNVTDVPRIAKQAGAKRVAMCHYSLDFRAGAFENAAKRSAAQVNYRGEVLAPDDLDVLYV